MDVLSNLASKGGEHLIKGTVMLLLIFSLFVFNSCGTVRGIGEDIGKAGAYISEGAKKTHKAIGDSFKKKQREIQEKEEEEKKKTE